MEYCGRLLFGLGVFAVILAVMVTAIKGSIWGIASIETSWYTYVFVKNIALMIAGLGMIWLARLKN